MAESAGVTLSEDLLAGMRGLEDVPGFSLDGPWQREGNALINQCTVTIPQHSAFVDSTTRWVVMTTDNYPVGSLHILRAPDGGVRGDFPNELSILKYLPPDLQYPRPCLITRTQGLGRWQDDPEPTDAFSRLAWHAVRLIHWTEQAARGTLLKPGDLFGHPLIHHVDNGRSVNTLEDAASLNTWLLHLGQSGEARLRSSRNGHLAHFTTEFLQNGASLLTPAWGSWVGALPETPSCYWVLLARPPFIEPWGFPSTWGELRKQALEQGVQIDVILKKAIVQGRNTTPILMVGYPVPAVIGGPDVKIEWQTCTLPTHTAVNKATRGFRNLPNSWWLRARRERLYDGRQITWLLNANHQPSELGSRGFLPQPVRDRRFLLIGAGALGSAIAEHLVRTGVTHVTLLDSDSIQTRNLVRHTLTLDDVPGPKALQLAKRLQAITTLAQPQGFNETFPYTGVEAKNAVQNADVIIDTTGSDRVLTDLGQATWDTPKDIISLSLAWRAAALYAYAERTTRFNAYAYQQAVRPHLVHDLVSLDEDPTVMDGIGCWDPVWPALHTDVQLLAAAGAKFVASFVQQAESQRFQVYEQVNGPTGFEGLRLRIADPT